MCNHGLFLGLSSSNNVSYSSSFNNQRGFDKMTKITALTDSEGEGK